MESVRWFARYGSVATAFAAMSGANVDTLLILKSRLMYLEMFNAPLCNISLKRIFWDLALYDISLKRIFWDLALA
ncbi:29718_t:CDS:1, partial [Racocetra persica]